MPRQIVLTVDVDADRQTVYDAVATTQGLAGFWTPKVTGSSEMGATLRFGFEPAPVELEMVVDALEPADRVAWSCPGPWPHWEGTSVEWRLGDAPDKGTRTVFVHTGWDDDYDDGELGSIAFTWALVLAALERYVETGVPEPALR